MLKYTEEFASEKFIGKDVKSAYLKACKWFASNIMANKEFNNVQVKYEKVESENAVIVHLYVSVPDSVVSEQHCQICRETHSSFFMSEETNCAWCKVKGYQNRINVAVQDKVSYYKHLLFSGGIDTWLDV